MKRYILTRHSKNRFQERTILNRSKEMQDKFKFAIRKGVSLNDIINLNIPNEIKKYMEVPRKNLHKKYYKGLIFVYHRAKNGDTACLITVYGCWETYMPYLEKVYEKLNSKSE